MNRNISTGLDVAAHISHHLHENAALGVIVGEHPVKPYDPVYQGDEKVEQEFIDLREELKTNCKMQILTHKIHKDAPQAYFDEVNKAYWRTCSFFLAYCIQRSFADSVQVTNLTILNMPISEGCFAVEFHLHDSDGNASGWEPSELDLNNFTKTARNFLIRQPKFLMSGKNTYSLDGDMAEFDGPLVHSLDLIGPFAVTSCSRIGDSSFIANGVSMPKEFAMNHAVFGLLEQRARNSNVLKRSPILSNVSKRKNFTYKQWTDTYNMASETEIDLRNRQEEIKAEKVEKRAKMEPDPYHELNMQYREYEVGRKRMNPQIRVNELQRHRLMGIWNGGKFKKTIYIDHEQQ